MKLLLPILLLLTLSGSLNAQTSGLGTWQIYNAKLTLKNKWSVFLETHIHSQYILHDFNFYEVNLGAGYAISKNISLAGAFGHYSTFQPKGDFKLPMVTDEIRIWEQLTITSYLGRMRIEQRFRLEQLFSTTIVYRNRLRFRLAMQVPLNHAVFTPGTFYLSGSNESILSNEKPFYDQNWAFIGAGYQIGKRSSLQAGLMNRMVQPISGIVAWKNFFQTTLAFAIN